MDTVKSTINLNRAYKEQLEMFVRTNQIASVTEGVNAALSVYIKMMHREMYAKQMREAAADPAYIGRTVTAQKDFDFIDAEELGTEEEEW